MNLLLDTHTLLWLLLKDARLRSRQVSLIEDERNTIYVSAVSTFEIATKFRIGKLPEAELVAKDLARISLDFDFREMEIKLRHGAVAGALEGNHRDPFDRLLAAQSLIEGMPIVTSDPAFAVFGVETVW